MKLLCIESSSDLTLIGITDGAKLIGERALEDRDQLAGIAAQLFAECGVRIDEIEAIAIGIGPGSFTGLRVGLAYAKGLARSLEVPIWPVPSLQIFAANLKGQYDSIVAISPARRGQCHMQLFAGHDMSQATEAQVIEYERLREFLSEQAALVGPGVRKLEAKLADELSPSIPRDSQLHYAHALRLAELATARWQNNTPPAPGDLVPEYGLEFGT